MGSIRASELRIGDKFTTRLTDRRGIVEDIKHVTDGGPISFSAPRVMLIGGGVEHKTLHPSVIVNRD